MRLLEKTPTEETSKSKIAYTSTRFKSHLKETQKCTIIRMKLCEKAPSLKENSRSIISHTAAGFKSVLEPAGKWRIVCDFIRRNKMGKTDLDIVWKTAIELFEKGVFTKIVCFLPSCKNAAARRVEFCDIFCYVPDYKNLENVYFSATELRKKCNYYSFPLVFETQGEVKDGRVIHVQRYLFDQDGNLYKRTNGSYKLKAMMQNKKKRKLK